MMRGNKQQIPPCMRNNKSGAAMILVLCVMLLFLVLSLSIIFSSSVLVGEAKTDRVEKQCQLLATSFSKRVDEEITDKVQMEEKLDVSDLPQFVRYHIDGRIEESDIYDNQQNSIHLGKKWKYYWILENMSQYEKDKGTDDLEEATYRYYVNLGTGEDSLHGQGYSLHLEMHWTFEDFEIYKKLLESPDGRQYDRCKLIITTVCENGDVSYRINSRYELRASKSPEGGDLPEEEEELTWDQCEWRWEKEWKED